MKAPHILVGVWLDKGRKVDDELSVSLHSLYTDELSNIREAVYDDDQFMGQVEEEHTYELCLIRCDENIGDWRVYDWEIVDHSSQVFKI